MHMTIAEIIKLNRKQKGLTQQELGNQIGVSQDTISIWEKGKAQPTYDILRKLCIIFEIDGNEILELETEAQRKNIQINNSFNNNKGKQNIKF